MENGKAAVVSAMQNGIGFGSTEFHVLRPSLAVLAEYIYHFVRQESFRRSAAADMTGSVGQKRVPIEFLRAQSLPLPPLAEQRRIVAKVEALLERVNAVRERLARVPASLKRFRQSVLAAACSGRLTEDWRVEHPPGTSSLEQLTDKRREALSHSSDKNHRSKRYKAPCTIAAHGLPELPAGWLWCTFDQATILITKGSSPGWQGFEYQTTGVLFVRSQNIRWGQSDLSERVFVPAGFREQHSSSVIRAGDVLLNLVGASIGRCAVAPPEMGGASCNQAVGIIRPLAGNLLSKWAIWYLLSPFAQAHIGSTKADVARANFNLDDVRPMPLALPPVAEQEEIIRRVDALLNLADAIQNRVGTGADRADRLTQAILSTAFRGELVPTEAELARREGRAYEPAWVLVERIRAEREQRAESKVQRAKDKVQRTKGRGQSSKPRAGMANRAAIAAYIVDRLHGQRTFGRVQLMKLLYLAEAHVGLELGGQYRRAAAGPFDQWIHALEAYVYPHFRKWPLRALKCGWSRPGRQGRQGLSVQNRHWELATACVPLRHKMWANIRLEAVAAKRGWFTTHARVGNANKPGQKSAEPLGHSYRPGEKIAERIGWAEKLLGRRKPEMDRLLAWFAKMDTERAELFATVYAAWNDFLLDGVQPTDDQIIHEVRDNWHEAKKRFAPARLQVCIDWMRQHELTPQRPRATHHL